MNEASPAPARVKICGITRLDDALLAAEHGADLLGLNFYPGSKRYLGPDAARALLADLRAACGASMPRIVGVFVNAAPAEIAALYADLGLDAAQLSGDEPPDDLAMLRARGVVAFKAIRPASPQAALEATAQYALTGDAAVNAGWPTLLLDAYRPGEYGGTGQQAADSVALAARDATARLMLAGGLTPDNVAARVARVQPWGVDVAGGVEDDTPGLKDHTRLAAFIREAKRPR